MKHWDLPPEAPAIVKEIETHIREKQLRVLADSDGPVFYISDRYAGVWLEQTYDAVYWADYTGDTSVAKNQIGLLFKHQRSDGHLPMAVTFRGGPTYGQVQECVSIGRLCLDVYRIDGDLSFIENAYKVLTAWDAWLVANRMHSGQGLIEVYCGYDTGHDNSGRWEGIKYPHRVSYEAADLPEGCPVFPGIAPDMNAVFYGDRMALSEMAVLLGKADEAAAWKERAEEVRRRLFEVCYDPEDEFFYDVDKHGNMRRHRTVAITNVLTEHVPDQALADRIFERYLWNEKEFKTPYPWPAVSIADPTWHRNLSGNSWGYYSQAQTVLRSFRWMFHYGRRDELREMLHTWVWAVTKCRDKVAFGQELDPITGEPSDASPWYSSGLLLYLFAVRELQKDE